MAGKVVTAFRTGTGGLKEFVFYCPHQQAIISRASVIVMTTSWRKGRESSQSLQTVLFSGWTQEGPEAPLASLYLANELIHTYGSQHRTAFTNEKQQQIFYNEHFGFVEWIKTPQGVLLASQLTLEALWKRGFFS